MGVLPKYVYVLCEPVAYQGQERGLDPLNLEIQVAEPAGGCWKSNPSHQDE